MKPLSKKTQKAIGITAGVGAIGITAYLIYKYLKKESEVILAEEEFVIPTVPISLENILLIIQDVTLTTMEKIAILEAMYNEQFITSESQSTEIVQIEEELILLEEQIAQVLIEIEPYEEEVELKLTELNLAQVSEADAYNEYIRENNKLTIELDELSYAIYKLGRCAWYDFGCLIKWQLEVERCERHVDTQQAITIQYWNIYLDTEQLRKEGENEYNSAILSLELFKEENLFPLQEEHIVLINSLTMWKIAYQASQNILAELLIQLGLLGVETEPEV